MKRGEVYEAKLDSVEGSEQGGTRPVILVSREAINISSNLIIAVPCTTYRASRRLYPSQILIQPPDGGFDRDTIALENNYELYPKLVCFVSEEQSTLRH